MKAVVPLLTLSALALAGCDQLGLSGGGDATTDTNMRSVDIEAGTASDEMVILDTASGDGTAIDPSSSVGPATPRAASADDEEDDGDEPSTRTSGSDSPPRAAAEPAERDEPADEPEPAEK
jgi:hypothetical protein